MAGSMISGFDSDLFLSYAHLDNEALVEGQRGWVSNFRDTLEKRLGQVLGARPKVWWDHSGIRGNDAFAERITLELGKVAFLVLVLSPGFLASQWCRRELAAFLSSFQTSGRSAPTPLRPLFKVLKTPVAREDEPEALQELIGYRFFHLDPDTGKFRELAQNSQQDYLNKIDDLAQDISDAIRRLQGEAPPEAVPDADRVTLYLAESTFDVVEERDQLLRSLRQRPEITVLPAGPLPLHGPDLRAQIAEQIARCRLSIHLLGSNYGTIPEAEPLSMAEIQNEIAARRSAADPTFSRLLWIPPGVQPTDERQRRFLERLRTDADAQRGAEILGRSLEDLKTVLADKLAPPKPVAPVPAPGSVDPDGPGRIYLIHDAQDREAAEEVGDALFDRGFEVILPLFEGDAGSVQQYHRDSLTVCDGVLLFHGQAPEGWLRFKLLELQKAPGYGRGAANPLRARAVYLAPPSDDRKARFRTHEARVIHGLEGFSPELLAPFLADLEGRA